MYIYTRLKVLILYIVYY